MQPISSRNDNLHKGPSGSREFNEIRNNLHHDIYTLFNVANTHEDQIKSNMDILIRENYFLQNRLALLETALEQAKTDLRFKEKGERRQKDVQSFYARNNLIFVEDAQRLTDINTMYGVATLNATNHSSKVSHKMSDGSILVPPTLKTTLYESNNTRPFDESTGLRGYYVVEDTNVKAMFDQDKNTFWTRTVSYASDKGITEVYGTLHIQLPVDYLADIYSNTITINPYPEYSMDIVDITYKGYGDQWFRLPNFPVEQDGAGDESPIPFKETGKLIFTFPKREITEVQIHFRQPYWFKNGQNRDFTYGFQDINIEHRTYNTEEADFISVYDLEGTTKSFEMIRPPVAIPALGSEPNLNNLVTHKLYYDRNLTNEATFGNQIMADIKRVYIKTTMRRTGDTVPVLKEIHLDYDYKDDRL